MAEKQKKQRRERLSPRDFKRANLISNGVRVILTQLAEQFPEDVDLRIAVSAVQRFADAIYHKSEGAPTPGTIPPPAPPTLPGV